MERKKWWARHGKGFAPTFITGHFSRAAATLGIAMKPRYEPTSDEIPSGLCECGCGGKTSTAKYTLRVRRYFIGHPVPRLQGHAPRRTGADSHKWKGGRSRTIKGHVLVYAPDHPAAQKGYVAEHRLVMEKKLGRFLTSSEIVHHINGVKDDNAEENLIVLTHAEHAAEHPEKPALMRAAMSAEQRSAAGKKGAASRWGKR